MSSRLETRGSEVSSEASTHVVLAVVVVDETRANHQGGGEREGCVVMVRRSFSKRLLRSPQSAVNKLQISGADSTAVNKLSGAFNKLSGHSTSIRGHSTNFGGIQQHSTTVNSIQQKLGGIQQNFGAIQQHFVKSFF